MFRTACQECPFFNNSCCPYDQISERCNCEYLTDFDISNIGNQEGWAVANRRYTEGSKNFNYDEYRDGSWSW